MTMPTVFGIITARGGSKGIPRKNIARVAGRPLIAWTIAAARQSRLLTRLMVSTDDAAIAEISRGEGAEVPFMRPPELGGDDSSHVAVVRHALAWLRGQGVRDPDFVMLLQPTSPLRTATDIDAAIELVERSGAEAVVGVTEVRQHPYLMYRLDAAGRLTPFVEHGLEYARRQDLPPLYAANGAIYLIRPSCLERTGTFTPAGAVAYLMPPERSLDVDTPWDLQWAEWHLSRRAAGAGTGEMGERP